MRASTIFFIISIGVIAYAWIRSSKEYALNGHTVDNNIMVYGIVALFFTSIWLAIDLVFHKRKTPIENKHQFLRISIAIVLFVIFAYLLFAASALSGFSN